MPRTLETIRNGISQVKKRSTPSTRPSELARLKKNYGSVDAEPLLTCIPLSHATPPPMHIMMGIVNSVFTVLEKHNTQV